MRRGYNTSISHGIRAGLDRLDAAVSRFGRVGATAALSAMTVTGALAVHLTLRVLERRGLVESMALVNVAIEALCVATPLILYARDVIDQLKKSRAHLDVMSRRLAASVDAAETASKAKSAFLANMSHELRTPLNAIMGFSEVMRDEHLGPLGSARYVGYAADIHASGRHLLGIINDILDLSKIEAGKMSLDDACEFALVPAVQDSLTLIAPLADKYGVRLVCTMAGDTVQLLAVERMVRQILINLLSNAIKFTPSGGKVEVQGRHGADGSYALMVRDNGIGMNEGEIAKALTPFGQIQNKFTATHNGTGLGLPLAKAMLELHDGYMAVHSVPHMGTTITLHFPAARVSLHGASTASAA